MKLLSDPRRLAMAILTACSCLTTVGAGAAPDKAAPATGMVAVTVNFVSTKASPYFDHYHTFSIIPVGLDPKGKPFDSVASQFVAGDVRGTLTYTVVAPVGRYTLHRIIGTYHMGDAIYTTWIDLGDMAPEFDLQADGVVDVGTIVVMPLGRRFLITRLPSAPGVIDHALATNPREDAARFSSRPPVSLGDLKSDSATAFGMMQSNAAFSGGFHRTRNGRVLAPGKLGQLFRSEEDGRWVGRSTGVGYNLHSVNEDRSGGLLVSAEFGTILRAAGLFDDWRAIRLPLGSGLVYGTVEAESGDLIAVAEWERGPVSKTGFWASPIGQSGKLYRTPMLRVWRIKPDGTSTVLEEMELAQGADYNAFTDGDDLILTTGAKRMGRWDGKSGTWAWSNVAVDYIDRNFDGTWFGGVGKREGAMRSPEPFISLDKGRTWQPIAKGTHRTRRVRLESNIVMGDAPGVYFAMARDARSPSSTFGLYVTTDLGINWRRDMNSTQLCGEAVDRMVQDGPRTWLVCEWYRVFSRERPDAEWVVQREIETQN